MRRFRTGTYGRNRFPEVIALLGGVFFLASGLWAMVDPESFFESAATFNPYNKHFIQDIGAFQIGLGSVLVLAAAVPLAGTLGTALLGVGAGSGAHLVSHIIGRDLGGKPETDIPLFILVTVLLLVAGLTQVRGSLR